jgi:hypothetical protein
MRPSINVSFELTQVIELPQQEVFEFLSEPSNLALWNYYVLSCTKKTAGKIAVGTLFDLKRVRDLLTFKIIACAPPSRITVQLQQHSSILTFAFELSPVNGNTCVVYNWLFDFENYPPLKYVPFGFLKAGIAALARKFIFSTIKPAVEQNFGKLKTLLETGQVVLQDGRHVVWQR